jgi:tetratricopeptide (TPR) repeat protein
MALVSGSGGTGDGAEFVQAVLARLKPIETFARWFYILLGATIILVGVAISASGPTFSFANMLLSWSVSLAVVVASTTVGALLGFLFGIPRSLQQQPPNSPAGSDGGQTAAEKSKLAGIQAFRNNTSLEEISDWLTKIIIGIGLVQFQTLMAYLYKAALLAAAFIAAKEINAGVDDQLLNYKPQYSSPFFFALILASLISGCLFVYLETRTRLTLLFVSTEKAVKEPDEQKLANSAARPVTDPQIDIGGPRGPPTSPAPATQDDKDIAKLAREKLTDPKDIVGWALAQARVGNYDVAEDALRDALQKDPGNDDIRLQIADVRRLRGNFAGSNEMTNEVIGRTLDPAKRAQLMKRTLRAALYVPEPYGFRQAISVSDMLIKEKADPTDARIYCWRAAAFGQSYDWLSRNAGKPEELKEARNQALEALKKVVELAPDYDSDVRRLVRELFDPAAENCDPDENDLAIFNTDKEFRDVVYKGKP